MEAVNKLTLASILSLILILFTGCFGIVEVSDRVFSEAIGIDKANDEYTISVLLFNAENSEKINRYVVSDTGDNIGEALENIKKSLPKNLFSGHTKLIVLGGDVGINDNIPDFADEKEGLSPSVLLAFAPDGAENILKCIAEKNSGDLGSLINYSKKMGSIIKNNIVDIQSNADSYYASVIKEGINGAELEGAYAIEEQPYFISETDCRNINLFKNELRKFGMTVDRLNVPFYSEILNPACKIEVLKSHGRLIYRVNLKCKAKIDKDAYEKAGNPQLLLENQLECEINRTLQYCKRKRSSLLQLEKRAMLKYPELSILSKKELTQVIDNALFEVHCEVK